MNGCTTGQANRRFDISGGNIPSTNQVYVWKDKWLLGGATKSVWSNLGKVTVRRPFIMKHGVSYLYDRFMK